MILYLNHIDQRMHALGSVPEALEGPSRASARVGEIRGHKSDASKIPLDESDPLPHP